VWLLWCQPSCDFVTMSASCDSSIWHRLHVILFTLVALILSLSFVRGGTCTMLGFGLLCSFIFCNCARGTCSPSSIIWLAKWVSCGARTPSMCDYFNHFSKNLTANVPRGHVWLLLRWPHWTLAHHQGCDDTPFKLLCKFVDIPCGTKILLWLSLCSSEVFWTKPLCVFQGFPFFIRGLLNEPLCIFQGLSLFSSEFFWMSPFAFFGDCLFFHRRSFEWAPLHFSGIASFSNRGLLNKTPSRFSRIASFSIGGLLNEPLSVFRGLPLFSSEVFWTGPFAFFTDCLFFHQSSFEQNPFTFFGDCLFFHRRSFERVAL
jgi:hypothetical protein